MTTERLPWLGEREMVDLGVFGYGRKQSRVRKLETESVGPEFELSTRIMKVGTGQASQ